MKRRTVLICMAVVLARDGRLWRAHYLTAVPGVSHQGALPPSTDAENATAARLHAHRAIASKPHNVEHYDELEKAARYIEAS